jgi:predicted AlkP superfamily phosphohydrolase/phosphomutase
MNFEKRNLNRRQFLKESASAFIALNAGLGFKHAHARTKGQAGKTGKMIIIGIDGMDPILSENLMNAGRLPNFDRLRKQGGFSWLGTSNPPQSPVAWANFINGAGPGSHGIFDFIHRHPEGQCLPFFAMAETVAGEGYWEIGDHKLQLDFWPINHKPAATILQRQGVPFWDYLDRAGIESVFYNLPCNYPPSPSKYKHHKCLSGMGTPDLHGTYGTYQYYSEDGPVQTKDEGGGMRSALHFENETAHAKLIGPPNTFLKEPKPVTLDISIHRDKKANAAAIEIQGNRILLKEGQWSRWIKLDFGMSIPAFIPDKHVSGICRFYLQQVNPILKLYVSPINSDPSESVLKITEPAGYIKKISDRLGLFYTTGFQEDHKALSNKVFTDDEFSVQADMVLQERLNLLEYALENYDDGVLFFYFSSTDLQSHMFWWDSNEKHPTRSPDDAIKYFDKIKQLYEKMDGILGDILKRYGDQASIIVMSDHGFANFKRQFNLNTWLRDNGYIQAADATSIMRDVDWHKTKAYGLGINGLYLNLLGRERYGIVDPGRQRERLLEKLIRELESVRDFNGRRVIRKVHRTDKIFSGDHTALAPDLIVGYYRDYRASWATTLGDMTKEVLSDNTSTWSADHCADSSEVPGVIFSNRTITASSPSLADIAPSILTDFGLEIPPAVTGKNIFEA